MVGTGAGPYFAGDVTGGAIGGGEDGPAAGEAVVGGGEGGGISRFMNTNPFLR